MTSSSLLQWFPVVMATYVMDLVTPVWNIFLANTSTYPATHISYPIPSTTLFLNTLPRYVMGVVNCEGVRSEDCDSDGELVSVETCVFAVFEFISGLVESHGLRRLLPPILPTLAHNLIAYMQLTEEEVYMPEVVH